MNPRLFCLDLYNKFELIDVSFKQVHIYIFCLPKYSNSLQAISICLIGYFYILSGF